MKIAMLVPDNRDEFRLYDKPDPFFGPAPTALLEGVAKMAQCKVHIVCCIQQRLRSPAKLADNIYYHSLLVPKWGWLRGAYLGCVRAIRKKLREIEPDIVHGQGTERYCGLAAVCSGFPNVLTIHGNMRLIAKINQARPFSFQWLAARLEVVTLPRTAGVFCNSKYTEELVRSSARRTWLVPNAVREKFFDPPRAVELRPTPVLLNIGVIEPRKAQNQILEMAERLHRRSARFALQFVGRLEEKGSYGARFRDLANQGRNRGFVNYLGEKSQEELIALMDQAAALIHAPSEESFGLVVAEALARNLRLFGFKVGGMPDICAGVDGAELVEPGNFAALEEVVFKWLSAGAPKSSGGMERMRERYHPDVIARRHLAIYGDVLSPM